MNIRIYIRHITKCDTPGLTPETGKGKESSKSKGNSGASRIASVIAQCLVLLPSLNQESTCDWNGRRNLPGALSVYRPVLFTKPASPHSDASTFSSSSSFSSASSSAGRKHTYRAIQARQHTAAAEPAATVNNTANMASYAPLLWARQVHLTTRSTCSTFNTDTDTRIEWRWL